MKLSPHKIKALSLSGKRSKLKRKNAKSKSKKNRTAFEVAGN